MTDRIKALKLRLETLKKLHKQKLSSDYQRKLSKMTLEQLIEESEREDRELPPLQCDGLTFATDADLVEYLFTRTEDELIEGCMELIKGE